MLRRHQQSARKTITQQDTPTLHKHLDQILKRLKSVDGKLWVIIRENTPLKRN
jgi:hypothetical protein